MEGCLGIAGTAEGFERISWHLSTAALFCWICVATPAVEITSRREKNAPIPLAAAQSRKVLSSVIVPEKESAKTMKLTSCLWNP